MYLLQMVMSVSVHHVKTMVHVSTLSLDIVVIVQQALLVLTVNSVSIELSNVMTPYNPL